MAKTYRFLALCCVFVSFIPSLLFGQSSNAAITGQVTDPTKAVVPQAKVRAINNNTNVRYEGLTDQLGTYLVVSLPPGDYRIEVEKVGFKTIVKPDVVLHVQDTVELNFEMALGSASETVTVAGGAPLVNTQSAAVSTVVTREQVENMPLNGRSFQSLIMLTPGVVLTPALPGQGQEGQFSVNGQRTYSNSFTVDGVSANVGIGLPFSGSAANGAGLSGGQPALTALGTTQSLVSVDALQEFRIQTSSSAPEFGRQPGAQVELVTRSGTNGFHGSLFEYLRNDVFDANNWFFNSIPSAIKQRFNLTKPALRQNDLGGTFGGPVRLPGYNGRDHTFIFVSYEGLRVRQPLVRTTTVPSLCTRQSAPGCATTPAVQPAVATLQPLLNAFPQPNGPDALKGSLDSRGNPTGFSKFFDTHSNPSTINATSIRIDHTFNDRFALFGRYADTPSESSSDLLSSHNPSTTNTQTVTVGAVMRFTNNMVNELRGNFSRVEAKGASILTNFGGAVVPPDSSIFPSFASSKDSLASFLLGNASATVGTQALNLQRQINVVDSLSVTKGTHALKFGLDYRRSSPVLGPRKYEVDIFFFSLAAMQSGTPDQAFTFSQLTAVEPVFANWSLYAQDSWHANSRLTLTYGVRWDVNPLPHNANGPDPAGLTGLNNPATFALAPAGTPVYPTRYNNFAPRFGAAYQLRQRPGWETVLRGGAGVFSDLGTSQSTTGFATFPNAASNLVCTSFFPPFCPTGSYPLTNAQLAPPTVSLTPPFNGRFSVYDPQHFNLPYTVEWNLAVQQALGANQSFTATYVGNMGRRLLLLQIFGAPNATFTGSVNIFRSDATSDYDALQLQYQQRLSHGLEALVSYTWAHAIDDISQEISSDATSRSNSDFDVRHNFAASLGYSIPMPLKDKVARAILGNWGVDTIILAHAATPVNLICCSSVFGTLLVGGQAINIRPDVVPGQPFYLHDPSVPGHRRFNVAAFTAPPTDPKGIPLRQGTLGRNVLRGLPVSQVNFSIRRRFNLTERLNLQFRADAFNLLNHPNFSIGSSPRFFNPASTRLGVPETMLGRSLGGLSPLYQIGGPRSLQLSLRLAF